LQVLSQVFRAYINKVNEFYHLSIEDDIELELKELEQTDELDFINAAFEQDVNTNKSMNALVLSRRLQGVHPDLIFVNLGYDINADQKEKIIQKIDDFISQHGLDLNANAETMKYLIGADVDDTFHTQDSLHKHLETNFLLEFLSQQAILGVISPAASDVGNNAYSLLEKIAGIHGEQINQSIVNNSLNASSNALLPGIIPKIINTLKFLDYDIDFASSSSDELNFIDIEVIKNVIEDYTGLDPEFEISKNLHSEAQKLIQNSINLFKRSDTTILTKSIEEFFRDIEKIYGEEIDFNQNHSLTENLNFSQSLWQSFSGRGLDVGSEQTITIELLYSLENHLSKLSSVANIPQAALRQLNHKAQVHEFISGVLESAAFHDGNISSKTSLPNMKVFFEKLGAKVGSKYSNLLKDWLFEQEDTSSSLDTMNVTSDLLKRVLGKSNELQNEDGGSIGSYSSYEIPTLKTIKYLKLDDLKATSSHVSQLIETTQESGFVGKSIAELETELSAQIKSGDNMISNAITAFLLKANETESAETIVSFDSINGLKRYLSELSENFSDIYNLNYLEIDNDPRYDKNALKYEINETQIEDLTDRLKLFKSNLADNKSESILDVLQSLSIMVDGDFRSDDSESTTGLMAKVYKDLKKASANLNFDANANLQILKIIDNLIYQNIINEKLPQASHENGNLTGSVN
jgi:hypothetical protein